MLDYWIIEDLGDTDLYKLTMLKFVTDHYPNARVRYELKFRSDTRYSKEEFAEILRQVGHMKDVRFDKRTLYYLTLSGTSDFLGNDFITYLKGVEVNPKHVHLWLDSEGRLQGIVEGPWSETILWELIILPIVSEVHFAYNYPALTKEQKTQIYWDAVNKGMGFRERKAYFIEMGTRRRYSREVQGIALEGLKRGATDDITGKCYLLGSSNTMFSAHFGIIPQGTMAHEIFCAVGAMVGVENANNVVLGKWSETYHGLLGVALPDTFTTEFFLRTYNPFYANLYYGLRHDSHKEPNVWTDMVLEHFESVGVDARAKRLVFSDGINNFDLVDSILEHRPGDCLKTFGIGTWLTNDLTEINGAKALNVVMKLVAGQKNSYEPMRHAVKLSDVEGKEIGDPATIEEYKRKVGKESLVLPLSAIVPN